MIYYFVTQSEKFGKEMVLYPRIPKSIDFELGEDNKTQRICVSPTIKQCLDAIKPNIYKLKNINIYICNVNEDNKSLVYYPSKKEVPDVLDTNEVWLLKPTNFQLLKSIKFEFEDSLEDLYNKLY